MPFFAVALYTPGAMFLSLLPRCIFFLAPFVQSICVLMLLHPQTIIIRAHYRHMEEPRGRIVFIDTSKYQLESTITYPNFTDVFQSDAPISSKIVRVSNVFFRVFFITVGYTIREAVVMRCPEPTQPYNLRGVNIDDRTRSNSAIIL